MACEHPAHLSINELNCRVKLWGSSSALSKSCLTARRLGNSWAAYAGASTNATAYTTPRCRALVDDVIGLQKISLSIESGPMRVGVYVDGYNLYYGGKRQLGKQPGWR